MIANCVKPFNVKDNNNLNSDDVVKLANEVKPQLLIITHFGKQLINEDPMFEAREIQRLTKIRTIAPKEGFVLDPGSFSDKIKQKSLNYY